MIRLTTVVFAFLLCLLVAARPALAGVPSVAFFYGPNPPMDTLSAFDWVVVDGQSGVDPQRTSNAGDSASRLFAYLSLGELRKDDALATQLPEACKLGENPNWQSWIVDQSNPRCRDVYLNQVVTPLLQRGFRGFFLDTLDSYQLALTSPERHADYQAGLVALIDAIHQRAPDVQFILNRGFELIPRLGNHNVVGVAAESLYRGWDQSRQQYRDVPDNDRRWLLDKLHQAAAQGITPIAIDYVAPDQREQARDDARQIAADGIVPYVTNPELSIVGVGQTELMPRQILMLFDGDTSPVNTNVNWYAAMPLNHLGYATRSLNIDREPLPAGPLTGQVAGVIVWTESGGPQKGERLYRWIRRQIAAGVPVVLLGEFNFPLDADHLLPLGLATEDVVTGGLEKATVTHQDASVMGFEGEVLADPTSFTPLQALTGDSLLRIGLRRQSEDAVAVMPWGGYALAPYAIRSLPQGTFKQGQRQALWQIDPFEFFRRTLRLPSLPMPDTTTLSGRRLLFAEVDGDGFSSGSWIQSHRGDYSAKVILDTILTHYPLPTAVSVIAAEFVNDLLYPRQQVARMSEVARAMFRLPWVEMGSHTYSHPFDWSALEANPALSAGLNTNATPAGGSPDGGAALQYGYNLPVPGYRFNPATEVTGAAEIINNTLAPPGKQVRLLQWSGDTDPGAGPLALADQAGLANINGNNSTISRQWPSLTNVSPLGVWQGEHFQVFSPDANEDQFTDGWQPPYCGYQTVLQTFEMTDSPRRLAPIGLYYHFYSGERPCGLKALKSAYDWAMKQSTTPIFPSTYASIALGFERATVARTAAGLKIGGYGKDQTLRASQALGYPDFEHSANIAGFNDHGSQRYINLGPGNAARLVMTPRAPVQPYLSSANGTVTRLGRAPGQLTLSLDAQVPLSVTLGNTDHCRVTSSAQTSTEKTGAGGRELTFKSHHADISVSCPTPAEATR